MQIYFFCLKRRAKNDFLKDVESTVDYKTSKGLQLLCWGKEGAKSGKQNNDKSVYDDWVRSPKRKSQIYCVFMFSMYFKEEANNSPVSLVVYERIHHLASFRAHLILMTLTLFEGHINIKFPMC